MVTTPVIEPAAQVDSPMPAAMLSQFSPETASELRQLMYLIADRHQTRKQMAWEIGQAIARIMALVGDGYRKDVYKALPFSERTAQYYIRIYEQMERPRNDCGLVTLTAQIAATAAGVPPRVRDDVLTIAASGREVDKQIVTEILVAAPEGIRTRYVDGSLTKQQALQLKFVAAGMDGDLKRLVEEKMTDPVAARMLPTLPADTVEVMVATGYFQDDSVILPAADVTVRDLQEHIKRVNYEAWKAGKEAEEAAKGVLSVPTTLFIGDVEKTFKVLVGALPEDELWKLHRLVTVHFRKKVQ